MPPKGNQFKSNTLRDESRPRQSSTVRPERERVIRQKLENLPVFNLGNGRAIKIAGLVCLVISVFFLIAFTSYLFTWESDQSYVLKANGGWGNLFKTQQELLNNGVTNPVVDNWLGKLGALMANQFMYEWFGIASYFFVIVFFVIGYRLLFKVRLFSVSKLLGYSFFGIVFFSIAIGYIHGFINDYAHYLEGEFGYWSTRLLNAQIGPAGTGCLLVFAALVVLIIAYNIDFKLPERPKRTMVIPDEVTDITPESVGIEDETPSEPIEWPRGNKRTSEDITPIKSPVQTNGERLRQEPLIKTPLVVEPVVPEPVAPHSIAQNVMIADAMAHEAITLTPTNTNTFDEVELTEEVDDDITLIVEETRPLPELSIEKAPVVTAN